MTDEYAAWLDDALSRWIRYLVQSEPWVATGYVGAFQDGLTGLQWLEATGATTSASAAAVADTEDRSPVAPGDQRSSPDEGLGALGFEVDQDAVPAAGVNGLAGAGKDTDTPAAAGPPPPVVATDGVLAGDPPPEALPDPGRDSVSASESQAIEELIADLDDEERALLAQFDHQAVLAQLRQAVDAVGP